MPPKIATAHAAPRCHHIRMNDQRCTQPALKDQIFCRFHGLLEHPMPPLLIPFVEDATSLQVAIMQVIRSLQLGKLDRRTAGTILYALQLASSNLKHFCHEAGHPLAEPVAKSKKQQEEEDDEDESLLEYLVKELKLEPPPQENHEGATQQPSAVAHDEPATAPSCDLRDHSEDAVPPRTPAPPAVKKDSGVIDDIKACDESRKHAGSSTRMRRARKIGALHAASSLGMTPVEECVM